MTAIKREVIGVDVDGVVGDFLSLARKDLKLLFQGRPTDDLVQTTWAFESLGITNAEERIFWKHVDSVPNWWMKMGKMPSTYLLPDLVRRHRVIFITNRKDGSGMPVELQTRLWLEEKFGLAARDITVVLSDNKGPAASGLKLKWFIDDRPKNVAEVKEASPGTITYIQDGTYNREYDNGLYRVNNFDEFAKEILRWEGK